MEIGIQNFIADARLYSLSWLVTFEKTFQLKSMATRAFCSRKNSRISRFSRETVEKASAGTVRFEVVCGSE